MSLAKLPITWPPLRARWQESNSKWYSPLLCAAHVAGWAWLWAASWPSWQPHTAGFSHREGGRLCRREEWEGEGKDEKGKWEKWEGRDDWENSYLVCMLIGLCNWSVELQLHNQHVHVLSGDTELAHDHPCQVWSVHRISKCAASWEHMV